MALLNMPDITMAPWVVGPNNCARRKGLDFSAAFGWSGCMASARECASGAILGQRCYRPSDFMHDHYCVK